MLIDWRGTQKELAMVVVVAVADRSLRKTSGGAGMICRSGSRPASKLIASFDQGWNTLRASNALRPSSIHGRATATSRGTGAVWYSLAEARRVTSVVFGRE